MIYDIKDFLKKFFSSRLFVLAAVIIFMFALLAERVFTLQIIKGADYQKNFIMLIKKPLSIEASRGNIYDVNGELLAYNQLAYSVVISDNGSYSSTKEHNRLLNKELNEIINVIKNNGGSIYNDFPVVLNDDGTYSFTFTSETSKKRFLSDVFGKKYDKLEYNKALGFDEANASAQNIIDFLSSDQNECFDISSKYDTQATYDIVVMRYAIKQNRFTKYKTTTIAKDVNDSIVAYVNEHSDTLTGISVEEDTIRKYNYPEYISSLIGYTGKISTDEYNKLSKDDDSYTQNDMVGKSGLEQYYESYLRGKNGEKQVYVNNVGKINEVISQENPVSGNDVYLSIDIKLQEATYKLLEQEIAGIVYSKIKSGEIPISDVYFALINNNVVDLTHFNAPDASATEQAIYNSFSGQLQDALSTIDSELEGGTAGTASMSEQTLDYFTCVMSVLNDDGLLLSKQIDTSDSTYTSWKAGTLSPRDYLKYCISKQWIDITKLDVNQKYADSSEIYTALCSYIRDAMTDNKDFAKIIYKYMVNSGAVTGQQLCLLLFDQGVLDYDDATVNNIANGSISLDTPEDADFAKVEAEMAAAAEKENKEDAGGQVELIDETMSLVAYTAGVSGSFWASPGTYILRGLKTKTVKVVLGKDAPAKVVLEPCNVIGKTALCTIKPPCGIALRDAVVEIDGEPFVYLGPESYALHTFPGEHTCVVRRTGFKTFIGKVLLPESAGAYKIEMALMPDSRPK